MDLRLFGSVLWRFRTLVAVGCVVSLGLGAWTTFTVGPNGLSYRQSEVWQSSSLVLLTQKGFPWGRSTLNEVTAIPRGDGKTDFAPRFADTPRYQGLAVIYAHLAESDEVRREVFAGRSIEGEFGAEAVRASDGANYLPLIEIKAFADSPRAATDLAARATAAFRTSLDRQQTQNSVPVAQRVELPVVNEPSRAMLFEGRSMSRSLLVFLLGMALVVGLAFGLENLRPRRSHVDEHESSGGSFEAEFGVVTNEARQYEPDDVSLRTG